MYESLSTPWRRPTARARPRRSRPRVGVCGPSRQWAAIGASAAAAVGWPREKPWRCSARRHLGWAGRDALRASGAEQRRAAPSSAGTSATESTVAVGPTPDAATASGRYLPVRTSTPARPVRRAPPTSLSTSSPTITASAGRTPSPVSAVAKKAGAGLPTTTGVAPGGILERCHEGPDVATNARARSLAPRRDCEVMAIVVLAGLTRCGRVEDRLRLRPRAPLSPRRPRAWRRC